MTPLRVLAVVGTPTSGSTPLATQLAANLTESDPIAATVIDACVPADTLRHPDRLSDWLTSIGADLWLLVTAPADKPTDSLADDALRAALLTHAVPHAVIQPGTLDVQLASARAAWAACAQGFLQGAAHNAAKTSSPWRHHCGRCGDAGCERRLFDALPG